MVCSWIFIILPTSCTTSTCAENTLRSLFGWQHGSTKDICPYVIFRCTPPSGGAAAQLEPVQLLPPSRDDKDVEQKKQAGASRGRVDGYPVPVRKASWLA